jgi:hypothetical protein
MNRGTEAPPGGPARHDRLIQDDRHDPYRGRGKLADPTVCTECSACYHEGRWTWHAAPADAAQIVCPACRRVRDDYPGGYLALEGDFVREHEDEVVGLVNNIARRERQTHPLQRMIALERQEQGFLLTTTDGRLAQAIGNALHRAYEGTLDASWSNGQALLRATWRR